MAKGYAYVSKNWSFRVSSDISILFCITSIERRILIMITVLIIMIMITKRIIAMIMKSL